ncbi:MAG: hypothetical protein H6844_19315 [Alphaproteobacteria bacterium]|nr:hypothetical protein [Alphaproteobacteria bacterium]
MKPLPIDLQEIGIAVVTACGFASSTWAFRAALASHEQRWTIIWTASAFAALMVSYIPFLILLSRSMSAAIVLTGMIGQMLALGIAFAFYGEPITPMRALWPCCRLHRGAGLLAADADQGIEGAGMSLSNNASGFARAFNGVAVIAAIAGTIFVTPQVWPLVEMPIWHALLDLYSYETAG